MKSTTQLRLAMAHLAMVEALTTEVKDVVEPEEISPRLFADIERTLENASVAIGRLLNALEYPE